jgi:uncharacterized protein involved in type VI secretion and phage assembly
MNHDLPPDGGYQSYFGLYPAIVTNIVDPDQLGRVELRFPWLGGSENTVRAWATLLTPYAGDDQGFQILPEVDSQVVVGFEAGNLRRPYLVGACWNGKAALPAAPAEANDLRLIKTRSRSILAFDDADGAPRITLATDSGHKLELDAGGQTIRLTHSSGAVITMGPAGDVEIQANTTVTIKAVTLNVQAPVANFDGVVNCTTLVAKSAVVSPSYTPGAGNVW